MLSFECSLARGEGRRARAGAVDEGAAATTAATASVAAFSDARPVIDFSAQTSGLGLAAAALLWVVPAADAQL